MVKILPIHRFHGTEMVRRSSVSLETSLSQYVYLVPIYNGKSQFSFNKFTDGPKMISEIQANSAALVVFVVKVYNKEKQGARTNIKLAMSLNVHGLALLEDPDQNAVESQSTGKSESDFEEPSEGAQAWGINSRFREQSALSDDQTLEVVGDHDEEDIVF